MYRSLRVPLPLKRHESRLRLWSINAPAVQTANRYIATHGMPDILHSQNFFYAGLAGIRIAQKNWLPHILTEHSSLFLDDMRKDKVRVLQEKLPQIPCSLTVSTALADRIKFYVPEQAIQVVGNIVNTDFFSPGKNKKPQHPFTFTIAANFDSNKNIGVTLRAFQQAFAGKEDFRLIVCGNGPEKGNLMALSEKMGLHKQVEFINFLPREKLISLYRRSNVVVSSSNNETFGLTLVEAMACGVPIISTRSGGPQDFITDKVGLLVSRGNVEEMSEAMIEIHRKYRTYDPEKIRAHCIQNYSEGAIVNKLESIYSEIINRNLYL